MIDRRKFLEYLGISVAVLIAFPARLVRAKSLAISLEKIEKLQSVGGSAILKLRGRNVLFIRDSEETVRALTPTCTHKGCTVAFNREKNRIECPCHGSAFNLEGQVLKGPAPSRLTSYEAKLEDQRIIVSIDEN
jgi:cytochrome b6-f complex iron-sulfur subunit